MTSPLNHDLDYLAKLMDVTVKRHEVYSANLANVNTPGYKRSNVEFEQVLKANDLDGTGSKLLRAEPKVVIDLEASSSPNGNNVDLDKELGLIRKNALLYRTFAEFISAKLRMLRASIVGRNS